jgi:arylsulfatase A-like enzyme
VTLWILVLAACGFGETATPADGRSHVILVTLDTTRADALSSYGAAPGTTPHADALAASGVRFAWALSHVPSTLSSHASMLTGLDPHGHRVPRNGFPLDPDLPTLATALRDAGYDTRAVIAASVLDESMGLARGFAVYDDDLSIDQDIRYEDRGDRVTDRALAAVDARSTDRPLFLWVHYFDAHHPYEAPAEAAVGFVDPDHPAPWLADEELEAGTAFRKGLASAADMAWLRSTYQAEVHWQDQQVGRLLAGLGERGLLDDAVIAIAGDHGEMFGEEPARPMGHSFDVDLVVTRVPLVLARRGPSAWPAQVIDQPVALSDLGPTLLAAAGVQGKLGQGQDLGPLLRGDPLSPRPIFLEATRGRTVQDQNEWNNLENERGVVHQGQLFLRGPYGPDRAYGLDDAQTELQLDAGGMRRLERVLEDWDLRAPDYRQPVTDNPLRAALEALGYIDAEED